MLCLTVRFEQQLLRLPLPEGPVRLGSATHNEIVLPFPGISASHARIASTDAGLLLTDLGSKNGLVVDGKRVGEAILAPGLHVALGRATISVEDGPTSDVELAFRIRKSDSPDQGSEEQSETDSAVNAFPEGADAALRLVREIERLGVPISADARTKILSRGRRLLAADCLLLFETRESEDISVLAVDGALPTDGLLEAAASLARAMRGDVAFNRGLEDGCSLWLGAGTGNRRGPKILLAVTSGIADAGSAWSQDFFEFLADRLTAQTGRRTTPDAQHLGVPSADPLNLPPELVVGPSPAMAGVLASIRSTVKSRLDVLLLGETGTGKELFARLIHASGPNKTGPFVAINCAAIPSELLESELFGVMGRVATGVDPRPGLFLKADGGSIFLDEIGDLAEPLQAKILRFLQEREVMAVGASVPRKVDVRVISASNANLAAEVRTGKFRADLYFRLRGLQFHLPPLRERKEDIPDLVLSIASSAAAADGKWVRGVSRGALKLLSQHDWPGNIRELQMDVRRAVLICPDGGILQRAHFSTVEWTLRQTSPIEKPTPPPGPVPTEAANAAFRPLQERIDDVERAAIEEALKLSHDNKAAAARLLGITRNGLAMKIKRLKKH